MKDLDHFKQYMMNKWKHSRETPSLLMGDISQGTEDTKCERNGSCTLTTA